MSRVDTRWHEVDIFIGIFSQARGMALPVMGYLGCAMSIYWYLATGIHDPQRMKPSDLSHPFSLVSPVG